MPGSWSEANLDSFLANPQGFIVGNKMQIEGVSNKDDRGSLDSLYEVSK